MKSLKEQSQEAYERKKKEGEENDAQRSIEREKLSGDRLLIYMRSVFHSIPQTSFHIKPDPFVGVIGTIADEGFQFAMDENNGLSLIGKCPHCQAEVLSRFMKDQADFGEMLKEFRPSPDHVCDGTKANSYPTRYIYCGACGETFYPIVKENRYYCPQCERAI